MKIYLNYHILPYIGGERWEMTLTVNISKTKKYFQIPFLNFKLYWETAYFNGGTENGMRGMRGMQGMRGMRGMRGMLELALSTDILKMVCGVCGTENCYC